MRRFLFLTFFFCLACSGLAHAGEPVYDRVMKTKTLRCGYYMGLPSFGKDPNTGRFSGLSYEIAEKIGAALGLKIDWVTEVGIGDVVTALETNKIDAMCAPLWLSPSRLQTMLASKAMFYTPCHAYTRANDTRFDGALEKADRKDIRISAVDGDFSYDLAKDRFPKATLKSLPQMATMSDALLQVTTGKADIALMDQGTANSFNKHNPSKLRPIARIVPLRLYGDHVFFKRGEYQLVGMVDHAIDQLVNDGVIERILAGYNKHYEAEYRAPPPVFPSR